MDSTGKYTSMRVRFSVAVQLDHQHAKVHLLKNGQSPKSLQSYNTTEFTVIKLIYHFDNCSLFLWML